MLDMNLMESIVAEYCAQRDYFEIKIHDWALNRNISSQKYLSSCHKELDGHILRINISLQGYCKKKNLNTFIKGENWRLQFQIVSTPTGIYERAMFSPH